METQTQERTTHDVALNMPKGGRGRRGRKDSSGDEQVLKAQPIKEALGELMALYKKAAQASTDYSAARKAVAERSNANSADLNRLIKASAKGNFEDVQRHIQQQADLFETIGEASAGAATEK